MSGTVDRHRRRRAGRAAALVALGAAAAMTAAACGSGGPDSRTGGGAAEYADLSTQVVGEQSEPGEPVSGGEISYVTYNGVGTLDPADGQDGGATGGSEMAAIYDVLMRYDLESKEYVPQLAQGLSSTDDDTVWTMELRPDAMFSDGTAVDADAVVASIDRYVQRSGTHAQVWTASVAETEAVDDQTVRFTLERSWNEFPNLLTTGPGMIVAPTADAGGEFTPIGAGPFVVESFAPQEELVLTGRSDYWNGSPHLDRLVFPAMVNEHAKLDTLRTGGVDVAYLRYPDTVREALDDGLPGLVYSASMGGIGIINNRDGHPGEDLRVRQAIVAATDPEYFVERFAEGLGLPGAEMFQDWSRWHGDVAADGYDPDRARELLEEAKADGYDGRLTFVGLGDVQNDALAFQTMLDAVGFDVEIDYVPTINALIDALYVKHDYDLAYSGFNVLDESPFTRLYGNLHSESTANVLGYEDPQMDDLLVRLQTASDSGERQEVIDEIQQVVDETAPMAVVDAGRYFIPWAQDVHGVVPSSDGILLFGEAWKSGR